MDRQRIQSLAALLAAAVGAGCASHGLTAQPVADLLTAEQRALVASEAGEATRGAAEPARAEPPPAEAPTAGAPRIVIVAPDVSRAVAPPVHVELRFEPQAGATIDPGSFRVHYRTPFHDFDITEQALKFIHVTRTSAIAESVPMSGSDRLTLVIEIADSQRRVGRCEVSLRLARS